MKKFYSIIFLISFFFFVVFVNNYLYYSFMNYGFVFAYVYLRWGRIKNSEIVYEFIYFITEFLDERKKKI